MKNRLINIWKSILNFFKNDLKRCFRNFYDALTWKKGLALFFVCIALVLSVYLFFGSEKEVEEDIVLEKKGNFIKESNIKIYLKGDIDSASILVDQEIFIEAGQIVRIALLDEKILQVVCGGEKILPLAKYLIVKVPGKEEDYFIDDKNNSEVFFKALESGFLKFGIAYSQKFLENFYSVKINNKGEYYIAKANSVKVRVYDDFEDWVYYPKLIELIRPKGPVGAFFPNLITEKSKMKINLKEKSLEFWKKNIENKK